MSEGVVLRQGCPSAMMEGVWMGVVGAITM